VLNGKKIKALRKKRGLTLRQLSELTCGKVSISRLSEIENGKVANPTKKTIHALALVLGVAEWELFLHDEFLKGDLRMCIHRREYITMNGWVYYCELAALGKRLTADELKKLGCTKEDRTRCKQLMEYTCGTGIVPEPEE